MSVAKDTVHIRTHDDDGIRGPEHGGGKIGKTFPMFTFAAYLESL